jgi:hypothetical protein
MAALLEPMGWLLMGIAVLVLGAAVVFDVVLHLALGFLVASPFVVIWAMWFDRKHGRFQCPACSGQFSYAETSQSEVG